MKWSIITDSSCDYAGENTSELLFDKAPFVITIDNDEYIDDNSLCVENMISAMEESSQSSHTACPSPGMWFDKFMAAEHSIA